MYADNSQYKVTYMAIQPQTRIIVGLFESAAICHKVCVETKLEFAEYSQIKYPSRIPPVVGGKW